jgi:hypothetical protein
MESTDNRAVALLTSGHILKISAVMLYPADALLQIASIRSEAASKVGGVATGIGFIGSPAWAIGASAALGLLEGAMSNAARREAVSMLEQASKMEHTVLQQGLLFRVSEIAGVKRPIPALWSATAQTQYSMSVEHMGRRQRSDFLASHNKAEADVIGGAVRLAQLTKFAHTGDDFLTIDTDIGLLDIRWSCVATYVSASQDPPPIPKS